MNKETDLHWARYYERKPTEEDRIHNLTSHYIVLTNTGSITHSSEPRNYPFYLRNVRQLAKLPIFRYSRIVVDKETGKEFEVVDGQMLKEVEK